MDRIKLIILIEQRVSQIRKIISIKIFSSFEEIFTIEKNIKELLRLRYGEEKDLKIMFSSFEEFEVKKYHIK